MTYNATGTLQPLLSHWILRIVELATQRRPYWIAGLTTFAVHTLTKVDTVHILLGLCAPLSTFLSFPTSSLQQ